MRGASTCGATALLPATGVRAGTPACPYNWLERSSAWHGEVGLPAIGSSGAGSWVRQVMCGSSARRGRCAHHLLLMAW